MADGTKIEWTDATVNFWWGCTKVGPGCDHCYAETWAKRTGDKVWGAGVPRRKIKSARATLLRLQNQASWWAADHYIGKLHDHPRQRVFLQSMSDLFDLEVPQEWFDEAWDAIGICTSLELQLVTKRLPNVEKRLMGRAWPSHAGLIATVVNQDEADRDIPRLLGLKATLGIPWVGLSVEPMLGPVRLCRNDPDDLHDWLTGHWQEVDLAPDGGGMAQGKGARIDWVIVGGESGPGARPMHPDWARSLRDQCASAGVPFLFKQWGEYASVSEVAGAGKHHQFPDGATVRKVGKKLAGRLLDGVEHNGMPEARHG